MDGYETLESRALLAGDLAGHWRAGDLVGQVADGGVVTSWVDNVAGLNATGFGAPTLVETGLGGRATIRFDASDGDDYFKVAATDNPLANANDFSVIVAFATSAATTGGNGNWFDNTGLVDSNSLGFGTDWGLSINANGQLSAGMGESFAVTPKTVYSDAAGLNNGQLHVVAVTRRGDTLSLYVDDQPAVTGTGLSATQRGRLELVFGRLLNGKLPFTGDIAEIRIFNGELTSGEVTSTLDTLQSFYGNSTPVPVDDTYTTDEDNAFFNILKPGVLANDTDADGDRLTAKLVDSPQHGKVALQAEGGFLYSPDTNFNGVDTFTYQAFDFRGSETLGTVTINVLPKYDPARPVADSYKLLPNQTLNIPAADGVLKNDTNVDNAPLTAVLQGSVSNGQLTLNADGSFSYNSQGFSGTATFSYKVNDQTQLSSTAATVTLIVNTPPVATADLYTLAEDTLLSPATLAQGVLGNDVDADGNALTASIETAPTHGLLTLKANGTFSYQPELNYFGDDSFTYRVSDGVDTSDPIPVNLVINSVNDAPTGVEDFYFVLPDTSINITAANGLLSNDSDVEGDTLTARLLVQAIHGTATVSADGSFQYEANRGYVGTDTFTYSALDGQNSSAPVTVTFSILAQPLEISEFMASNADLLTTIVRADEAAVFQGEMLTPDWIEIHNFVNSPLDLSGMHLTDDATNPAKWAFPSGTVLPPSGYLVVFASGLDVTNPALDQLGNLHTNFQLDPDGEYLAVTDPSGNVLHEYAPTFPRQRTHVTYGIDANGKAMYFATPTPGEANSVGAEGLVADTTISVEHGLFQEPFDVELSNPTAGATIRYTTDGTEPTETSGIVYAGPIRVSSTTTLRARAFHDGLLPGLTETQTYFFLSDVVNQTRDTTLAAGFPAKWGSNASDYGFDSENQLPLIAGDKNMTVEQAKGVLQNSLASLPSLSLVMNVDDMFGTSGIYTNAGSGGSRWERSTSVEMINPDGSAGFQIDAGIRMQGGAFRGFGLTPKKSFRLLFKTKYGEGKLKYPVFGPDAAQEFDTLTLRMESNDGWQWDGAGNRPQYARDEFSRRTQLAMGQPASHGRDIHLYINGVYWGMYNMVERPDQSFGAAYFDADPYSWDGQNSGSTINAEGDNYRNKRGREAWTALTRATRLIRDAATEEAKTEAYLNTIGLNADGTRNKSIEKLLDPINYADYLITNYYGGNADWPFKNYYYGRENSPDSDGFKFFLWDAEWSLLLNSNNGIGLINDASGVAAPFRDLRTSLEFRLQFADRVQTHLFNGGALYVDPDNPNYDPAHPERNVPAARYAQVAAEIYDGLIAESARWGDQHRSTPYTRDVEWQAEYDRLMKTWFPTRTAALLKLFKQADLYPAIDTPTFSQRGGILSPGGRVSLSASAGKIYYTTDGSDPRRIGGELSPAAIEYTGPFAVDDQTVVKVRALNESVWSAIDEAAFNIGVAVPPVPETLRVSEVHYHPADATAAEIAAGFTDADEFEFIELANISNVPLDLSNVRFIQTDVNGNVEGVEFDFGANKYTRLAPGGRVVIVENRDAFEARYGQAIEVAGEWTGGLSNAGETLTLMSGNQLLQQFTYDDAWIPATDGTGPSLEIIDVAASDLNQWNVGSSWRASLTAGGTPGGLVPTSLPGDSNHDGIFNSADLVLVFQKGEYEDGIAKNSTFEAGDWDGDGDFTTADLVYAFQRATYVAEAIGAGRIAAIDAVFGEESP